MDILIVWLACWLTDWHGWCSSRPSSVNEVCQRKYVGNAFPPCQFLSQSLFLQFGFSNFSTPVCLHCCRLISVCVCVVNSYSHTSAVYKDYLILVGGVSFSCLSPPVEMVHLMTGHVEALELPVSSVLYVSVQYVENVQSAVTSVQQCVTAIEQWMAASRLRLNMDKTELIWTGTKHNLSKIPGSGRALTLGGAHCPRCPIRWRPCSRSLTLVGSVTRQARQCC